MTEEFKNLKEEFYAAMENMECEIADASLCVSNAREYVEQCRSILDELNNLSNKGRKNGQ